MKVTGQLHAPVALPLGKEPRYPLNRRPARSQSQSGRSGEEKNSQPLPRLEPQIIQPVAQRYSTELNHQTFISVCHVPVLLRILNKALPTLFETDLPSVPPLNTHPSRYN